jgi:hypothetical protein
MSVAVHSAVDTGASAAATANGAATASVNRLKASTVAAAASAVFSANFGAGAHVALNLRPQRDGAHSKSAVPHAHESRWRVCCTACTQPCHRDVVEAASVDTSNHPPGMRAPSTDTGGIQRSVAVPETAY